MSVCPLPSSLPCRRESISPLLDSRSGAGLTEWAQQFDVMPVKRDLCVTSAAVPLNVILSPSAKLRINYAKNPKGFIPRQRSFASKGFGFFTSLRSVQNDSRSASADIPRGVTQRSLKTGIQGCRIHRFTLTRAQAPCVRGSVDPCFRRGGLDSIRPFTHRPFLRKQESRAIESGRGGP